MSQIKACDTTDSFLFPNMHIQLICIFLICINHIFSKIYENTILLDHFKSTAYGIEVFSHSIMLIGDLRMYFRQSDIVSPHSILRYPRWLPRWPPRWPPIALGACIFVNIGHRKMILVSNSMFLGSRN